MGPYFSNLKNPLFVALDIDNLDLAMKIVNETHDLVGGFKIGPRFVFRFGVENIREMAQLSPIFLDFKLLDIPNTMEFGARAAFEMGASFFTIHTTAGPEAIKRMVKLEEELSQERPFSFLGVTILTSFNQEGLPANYKNSPIEDQVLDLVRQGVDCGLRAFVCSPFELKVLKEKFPECYFVTPGIRLEASSGDDQKRIAAPKEAIRLGASALVIGRPVLNSKNPREFVKDLITHSLK